MKNRSLWWIRIPLLFFLILGMLEYFVDSGDVPAIIKYPMARFFMLLVLLILIAIEIILQSIENIMYQTLPDEARARYLAEKSKPWEWKWGKKIWHKLSGDRPMAEEGEIVLDHNYDGIQELDNTLPPWWVGLFYATIIFAVVYLVRFEIFHDYDQKTEYEQEVAQAKVAVDAYKKNSKDLVDANTVTLLTDPSDLNAGKAIFQANCVACHMADGGGGIGPNLTDQYWIDGGGIKNVFHTISEGGRPGKGMVAWKTTLKPAQIAQVASYILKDLQGSTPANPKEPQGRIWDDDGDPDTDTTQ